MFWQFILLSFSSLSCTSFQLLKCVHLQPKEVFIKHNSSNWRFADDANLECFTGDHLPWGIVASVVVAAFLIPLPLSLPFLRHFPTFKPFVDVYSSLYKDNRRWWCAVDLLRRLLLAAVYTAEGNPEKATLAMVLLSIIFFFLQTVMWPYASTQANMVEAVLLFCLSVITVLSGPATFFVPVRAVEAVFFISFSFLLAYMAWHEYKSSKWAKQRKQGIGVSALARQDDMLREVLLTDESTPV